MFLNPIMLAGIGGAGVPVLLHLLSKARYRTVDWGAMMFLSGLEPRQQQNARLKQWVLLLIRMLIAAVLAIALARPVVRGRFAGLADTGRATAVIILDDSASMGYEQGGKSRLDQAKQTVLQMLSAFSRGDQVSLVLSGTSQSDSDRTPTTDLQSIAARVSDLRPGVGWSDIGGSLNTAADLLDRYEKVNGEIYVVCDRQANSWKNVDDAFIKMWKSRHTGENLPRLTVFDVGGNESDNVCVETIEPINPPAIRDQPLDVEVRLHNYGPLPRNAIPLVLMEGDKTLAQTTVTLAGDSATSIKVTARFAETGSHVFSAMVKSTGLTSDDTHQHAVQVIDPVKVLIISGDEPAGPASPLRSESGLIRLALSPYATANKTGPDPAVVTVTTPQKWNIGTLGKFDVVIVANVERFLPAQAHDLEQYVYGGGGLLLAPGNVSRIADYNLNLFRDGSGIMPAYLLPASSPDGSSATSILGIELNHPVFRFLRGRPDPIPSAAVVRYFGSTLRARDARVLASYASGKPFLIEGTSGRGKVLLVTTALDADWSTLPMSSFFLPFLQSSVRHLAGAGESSPNILSGQAIVASIEGAVDERSISMQTPDGRLDLLSGSKFEDRTDVRYSRTQTPGVYRLHYQRDGKPFTDFYVVSPPKEESDLTPLSDAQWQSLQARLSFQRVDLNHSSATSVVAGDRQGHEIWPMLFGMVLALAATEMLLVKYWLGHDK